MNKLPLSTTLLSVIVAVVLWYVATLLEGETEWPKQPEMAEMESPFAGGREDTAVLGGAAALRCQKAERDMQALVDEARHCQTDDDCTIFDYGYPIQCLTSVAKSGITALRVEYRDYEASCEHRVYYDCPSEPLRREPVCRNNRCEVELRQPDFLKDKTLQHIGVEGMTPPARDGRGRPQS